MRISNGVGFGPESCLLACTARVGRRAIFLQEFPETVGRICEACALPRVGMVHAVTSAEFVGVR